MISRCLSFRKTWTALAAIFLGVLGGFRAGADDQLYLSCQNEFFPPLIAFNLPLFPQIGDTNIHVLTDAGTPVRSHGVTVYNTKLQLNLKAFSFNVNTGGMATPNYGSVTYNYGQTESGTPQYFTDTIIAIYAFPGNNFPLWAWPDKPNWQALPVLTYLQFQLDPVLGWQATQDNSKNLTIQSDYSYTRWAYHSFLGYEWPYTPGASQPPDTYQDIYFDLRAYAKQDTNSPFSTCPTCAKCHKGMASATFDTFQAGVAISDTPISYSPPVGPGMAFTATYHQRQANQPATFNFSNLGQQWNFNWLTYISGGPSNGKSSATYHAGDGSIYLFGGYQQTVVQQNGGTIVNQGDFRENQGYLHATLHYRQNPERYERWLPDGSVEVFAQPAGVAASRLFFLTQVTSPEGYVTTLSYDPTAAARGNAVLTAVTDPTGNKLLFGYNTSNPLLVTRVTRTNDGLAAKLVYSNGHLASITDPSNITSSFKYVSGTSFIQTMTTPYGVTTFHSTDGHGFLEADMTNPLGQAERVEYQESLPTSIVPGSESAVPSTSGLVIDNTNLNNVNSFYWNRRAMADAAAGGISPGTAAFYALAETSHWAQSGQGSIPVALSTKKRLEGRVWYNYPNQPDVDHVVLQNSGASSSPSITARLVDSGASTVTQAYRATYNANGLITQSVDPVGRTTNYTYDSTNGIDLLQVSQVNGAGQDLLSQMTYNSVHQPLTVKDASGQVTTLAYYSTTDFSNHQLRTSTDAKNETTTLVYNTAGYLYTVTGPVAGSTTTYTYDSAGRVHTVTDSEGYTLTTAYDNLDRPTSVTYPDGTTDQTVYNKLDVGKTIDRQSRVTTYQYDAIRELVQTTDPQGRVTKYTWCTCGGLSTLTDPNNNVTTWNLDGMGRVTGKVYADSSQITYVYETNSSRLHTMTDAMGSVATYAYNADNTLSSTTYTPGSGVAATPNISFTYDTVYNRVSTMTDGTGNATYPSTVYNYNAVYTGGAAITGGGQLHTASMPVISTTAAALVTYGYDELGRVTSRTLDTGNSVGTTYDSLGRVTNVTNALGSFTYAYVNTTSRMSNVTYPTGTGLSTAYSYFNNVGDQRLQTIQNWKSNGTVNVSKFDYTYNPVGTIATWTTQADASAAIVNTYSYDGTDQLINAVQTGGGSATNAYRYDPAGNLLSENASGTTTSGNFNNLNQLKTYGSGTNLTVAGNASATITNSSTVNALSTTITSGTNFSANVPLPTGTNVVSVVGVPSSTTTPVTTKRFQIVTTGTAATALTYDQNGNCTKDENGNTYQWDALNRLIKITYPTAATSNFAYDGLSRRVSIIEKNPAGATTSTKLYVWIGNQIAEERNSSNVVQKRFFAQGEQQSSSAYYYTLDYLGSIHELVDATATIQARYNYDPYGKTTLISGSNLSTKQYAGYYQHQTSGLNLNWYRGYDSLTKRWLTRDPIGVRGGVNIYNYCLNSPTNSADSLGLDEAPWRNKWFVVHGTLFSGPGDQNTSAYTNNTIDPNKLGASLPGTVPPNTCIRICNLRNGLCIVVPIVDKGPHYVDDPYWTTNTRPKAETETDNQSGLDMTPATAKAMGLDYVPGDPRRNRAPYPYFNYPVKGYALEGKGKIKYESGSPIFMWQFYPCHCVGMDGGP